MQIIPWFIFAFPLIFSAGPSNLILASLATRYTFAQIAPFIAGLFVVNGLISFLTGLGLVHLLTKMPVLQKGINICGALYLMFLAFKIYRSSTTQIQNADDTCPGFWQGFILNGLNAKSVLILSLMFSQFSDPTKESFWQVILLASGFTILCLFSHLSWFALGCFALKKLFSERMQKMQHLILGGMLFGVALWMFWAS